MAPDLPSGAIATGATLVIVAGDGWRRALPSTVLSSSEQRGSVSEHSSFEHLSRLAEDGDRNSMAKLGQLPKSEQPELARGWLERAVSFGSWVAADILAKSASAVDESARWGELAVDLAEVVAQDGDPAALTFLAWEKRDVDRAQAIALSRRAANAGNVAAMGCLASWLRTVDPEEAERWEQEACAGGDVNGLALRGFGLQSSDVAEAIRLLKLAA